MKRILIIATVQSHVGQFHKPLMRLLKDHNWEIHVAARDNLSEKNGLQLEYPDKIFNVPFQRSPFDRRNRGAYKELKRILEQEHYDVIHCNTPVGGILGRLAGNKYRKSGTQVFYTAHGFHFYKGAPWINWLLYYPIEKSMSLITDKLITITEEDYQLASKRFFCKVFHIHGVGANSARYYPITETEQLQRKRELGLGDPVIINVGELLPNKNQKSAILAINEIRKKYKDAQLLIAGNGPERENLEKLAAEKGLEGAVVFLGYTTNLPQFMQICDVEIACSCREGLPLNVLEAMLCGKPVVASYNRGHRELIENGRNGFLVEPDDVKGYADAICNVLDHPAAFREGSLKKAEEYKDINVQMELRKIYDLNDD